ncbi:uncharacterized protein ACA1_362960 [Acanthamoeba castellanii str. Neff]|uniref:Ankyrin repeat-containing protein n=1 Tax=Acanthamoeba castellanii (strain ATCC 30010 / Neff) TaxID=1257118 RepID=L8GGD4_ACACF|nr:uncharacterized protein ACA1_362960 [Acanthamoeba castellanii str. Neff]ELR11808.1 hypothetical protein ACA1_362960 [Acanthamoeba castellanii str. Neff]
MATTKLFSLAVCTNQAPPSSVTLASVMGGSHSGAYAWPNRTLVPLVARHEDRVRFENLLPAVAQPSATTLARRTNLPPETKEDEPAKEDDPDAHFASTCDGLVLAPKDVRMTAVADSALDTLNYLYSKGWSLPTCMAANAASFGNLHVLRWLHKRGVTMDRAVAESAAHAGHINVLKWMLNKRLARPTASLCAVAAGADRINVVRWLRSVGCPWDTRVTDAAGFHGKLDTLQRLIVDMRCPYSAARLMWKCAGAGRHDVAAWLHDEGHAIPASALYNAMIHNKVETAKWVRAKAPPIPWNYATANEVIVRGHLQMVRWMFAEGCPYVGQMAIYAGACGHTDILAFFLCELKQTLGAEVALAACSNGRAGVFQWLADHRCPLDSNECLNAAMLFAAEDVARSNETVTTVIRCMRYRKRVRPPQQQQEESERQHIAPSATCAPPAKRPALASQQDRPTTTAHPPPAAVPLVPVKAEQS